MTTEMSLTERVRRLVERLAPAPVCAPCIAARLDLTASDHPEQATRELAGAGGFERRVDHCSLCGERRKVIRHAAS